ncbi:MAG: aminopeptidase P family protein [Desulfuromonadales bacterium]|nr:aminopeptidase P family protein [Desulfuromonadales bacterium]
MRNHRAHQVDTLLGEQQLDACVFLHPPALRDLCGFTGSDAVLVVWPQGDCFLTDSRYVTQARQQVRADEIRQYAVKVDAIAELLRQRGARRIGFEAETLVFAILQRLRDKGPEGAEWVALDKPLSRLRGIKEQAEIAAMEKAALLNYEAFEEILPLLRPGVRESEIALALEFALRRRGGEDKAFDFIVASGPRGALPHGVAADRELAGGELVTLDFGTRVDGYFSDETVTVALGPVSDQLRQIYDTVLQAHDLALAAVRPGVSLRQIDAVARDFIAARGYGDYFGHGLGHGVGLEVHEYPTLSPRSEDSAEEGMVFTIEPGIYIPDLGGVRLEDMVVVTTGGCRVLTKIDKAFRNFKF